MRDTGGVNETTPSADDRAARLRRAAELLGDLVPSQTSDDLPDPAERDSGRDAKGGTSARDREIAADVPPHHGG